MARFLWFGLGIATGFAVAHEVAKTEAGRSFFADVDSRIDRFSSAVTEGYHQRDAELRDELDSAKAKLDKLAENS